MNKCRIFGQNSRDKASYYKNYNEKKGKNQNCGEPYPAPTDKWKQGAYKEKNLSGG